MNINIIDLQDYVKRGKKKMSEKNAYTKYETLIKDLEATEKNRYYMEKPEELADIILKMNGYDKEGSFPIPVVKIIKSFGFKAYREENIQDDISGNVHIGTYAVKTYGHDKVIIVEKNESLFHQRFITAHELAHYLLDYLGGDKKKSFSMAYHRNKNNSENDYIADQRADRFAAELLMPKNVFIREYDNLKNSGRSSVYAVTYLSTLFQTKESSIRKRIKEVYGL